MDPDKLAELSAGKIVSVVLTLAAIIGFVTMLMNQLGPSEEQLAELEAQQTQWKEAMEAQRRYQQMQWEMQPTAAEIEAALNTMPGDWPEDW